METSSSMYIHSSMGGWNNRTCILELKDTTDDVDDADDTVHDDEVDPVEYELINVVVLPWMMQLLLPLILFDNMAGLFLYDRWYWSN